jgi:tetratricopeptide (TPR) repeat protein
MCNDCNEIFEDVKRFEDSMEDEEVEKPDSLFEEIKKINREFFHNNLAIDSMSVEDDYQDFLGAWDSSGNKGNIIISEAWGKFVDDQKLFISVYNAFIGFLTNSFNKNPESDESIEKQAGFPIEETDDLRAETLKKYEFDAKNNTNSYFDTMDWHIILDKYAREPDGKNKIVIMEKALAQHPDDQTLLIRSATFQVDEHKYQQALDLLKQAEKQGPPHHPNFYYVKANLYMQLQSPDQAIPLYKKLTDQKGDELKWWRTHSYDCLIDIYDEKKNYNECIVICKAMIEEQPDKDLLFSRLAYFYSQLNKHEDAVQILKSFIEKHPESSGCELQLGHTYKDMKKYEDAIIHYDNSFNIDRDENYGAIYNKGQILMELKRFDEAVVCFELCILYFKLEKDYNLAAGKCYVELKQNQLAIAHYRRALYIDRDCKEALDALLVLTKK